MEVNQELVERFKEICAVDDSKARQFLIHCDGELESAVHLFFQTGGVIGPQLATEHFGDVDLRRRNVTSSERVAQVPRPVVNRQQQLGWLDWFFAVATIPVRMTVSAIYDIFSFLYEVLMGRSAPKVTDPRGDVLNFVNNYEQQFTDVENRITFSHNTYEEVCQEAKRSLRMLLLYIHDSNNQKSNDFISQVMHGEQFRGLLAEKDVIVWGVSLQSGQGSYLAQLLRPFAYPYLALLSVKNNKMALIIHFSMPRNDEGYVCNNLRIAIEHHEAQLNLLRLQKAQREEDQRIRAEQEREYQESAAKDRARIQERKRLESEKADAEERERQKLREADERRQEVGNRRASVKESLGEEVTDTNVDTVRVQVRFPCGARLDRRFIADDSLEKLFSVIFVHEKCPDFFTAHTTYPRKELTCAPEWYHDIKSVHLAAAGDSTGPYIEAKTFREEGLEKSLVVMVHDCEA